MDCVVNLGERTNMMEVLTIGAERRHLHVFQGRQGQIITLNTTLIGDLKHFISAELHLCNTNGFRSMIYTHFPASAEW